MQGTLTLLLLTVDYLPFNDPENHVLSPHYAGDRTTKKPRSGSRQYLRYCITHAIRRYIRANM
ncbi:hypothetical protein DKP76_12405 [Falsochrobactrum shanghaiense]|uniref:Uncharacterized protein n=1 Tax=Falsochrobactrum shanghaiense TaxID=2201899 RepID=A0A316J774_9HYPH|nr:hypothetical protein DKP76_12405 [Falsochrobactrum shanghaiense]